MKVSSTTDQTASHKPQYGKEIFKPGIYRHAAKRDDRRLLVVSPSEKFYLAPQDRYILLQKADASLHSQWIPVKEKITITFDSTDEE